MVGGGVFGFVLVGVVGFGFELFGLVVFGLVPFGFVSFGVPLGFCSFGFPLVVPLGFVVPGLPVFGFVVPGLPVLGLAGVAPVGGFTGPVGGGAGVRDWPAGAEPAVPAPPGAAPPPGAACATIQVAHSRTTESKVRFLVDIDGRPPGAVRKIARCGFSYCASFVAE